MDQDLTGMRSKDEMSQQRGESLEAVPVPHLLAPHLAEIAILLDIDGTLLDLMPTPREVWVPPGLSKTLNGLLEKTSGALALVSGRSLNDIDLIFAPEQFPAVGGHGAEMRVSTDSEAVAVHAPPLDKELKRRLATIAKLSPGILLEDKGYSLALHYRLAPHAEKAIYEAVSLIRADLPNAPIEVLPGKCVCEIKHSGFTKATGVRELMTHEEEQEEQSDAEKDQRLLNGIEAQTVVVRAGGPLWRTVKEWGVSRRLLTPTEAGILDVAAAIPNRVPSEKQCLIAIEALKKMHQEGCQIGRDLLG